MLNPPVAYARSDFAAPCYGKGLPVEITCRFAAPLDDPSLRWLAWDWHDKSYVPFVVPAVGQIVELKGRF